MTPTVVTLVGNPRPESRTHGVAHTLARELCRVLGAGHPSTVDLAPLGSRVLDPSDEQARGAERRVLDADLLVVASPTYMATYSGLLKAFLDRLETGSLAGTAAVPILLGGAPDHRLAVDVHFTPLLLELGADVPARGLFVLESDASRFGEYASKWAERHAAVLAGAAASSQ
jgi:FMN reductase